MVSTDKLTHIVLNLQSGFDPRRGSKRHLCRSNLSRSCHQRLLEVWSLSIESLEVKK